MTRSESYYQILKDRAGSMSNDPTSSEDLLYKKLRENRIQFWKQIVVGFYIADIILPDRMLIVEVDGNHHKQKDKRKRDTARTKWVWI